MLPKPPVAAPGTGLALTGLQTQWHFEPGEQGPHLAKSASHSGQSTGNPLSAMMCAVRSAEPSCLNAISGMCSRNLPSNHRTQNSR